VQSLGDLHIERRRCSKEAKKQNQLKFAEMTKLPNVSQPLVGRRSRYCEDMWKVIAI